MSIDNLIVNLETGVTETKPLTNDEKNQQTVDKNNQSAKELKKADKKIKKNVFLQSLSVEQQEGFETIIKDGHIN